MVKLERSRGKSRGKSREKLHVIRSTRYSRGRGSFHTCSDPFIRYIRYIRYMRYFYGLLVNVTSVIQW